MPAVNPTGYAAPTTATTTSSGSVDRPDQFGNDTFLKLLVAQMRYQNPDQPADASEFMNQTAMFSQVQSMQQIAKQNTQMLVLQQALQAGALVGHAVSYTATDGTTKTGTVTAVRISASDNTSAAVIDGEPVDLGRLTEIGKAAG